MTGLKGNTERKYWHVATWMSYTVEKPEGNENKTCTKVSKPV